MDTRIDTPALGAEERFLHNARIDGWDVKRLHHGYQLCSPFLNDRNAHRYTERLETMLRRYTGKTATAGK